MIKLRAINIYNETTGKSERIFKEPLEVLGAGVAGVFVTYKELEDLAREAFEAARQNGRRTTIALTTLDGQAHVDSNAKDFLRTKYETFSDYWNLKQFKEAHDRLPHQT